MLLELSYVTLVILVNLFLVYIGFKAIQSTSSEVKSDKRKLVIALLAWQLFIALLGIFGVLKSYAFPPKIFLMLILPSFLFTGVFLFRNKDKAWIRTIDESQIVYFQSFRVFVELLLLFSFYKGLFNVEVTVEGWNFDLIFALTAPIVGYLVYAKKKLSRRVVLYWNCLGLGVLASIIGVFLTSVYRPEVFGGSSPLLSLEAFGYPYVLIAGFLMPVAVFLHGLSILQVRQSV